MKSYIIPVIIAALLFAGCSSDNVESDSGGNISGVVTKATVKQIYFEELLPSEIKPLDTAAIAEDGSFTFPNASIDHIGYYRIKINNQNYCSLVGQPGEKIHITGQAGSLNKTYRVEGSPLSSKFREVLTDYELLYMKRDSIQRSYQPTMDSLQVMELSKNFEAAAEEMYAYVRKVIDDGNDPFICQFIIDQLNPDTEGAYYAKVNERFQEMYPGNIFADNFKFRVQKMMAFAVGTEAPNIILPDRQDTAMQLYDLRGKVVLVDFWASWCKPCRAENPNVVKAYNKYKDKGFDVFSVSLDGVPNQPAPKEQWLQAIQQDGLIWNNHVSDLKGWNSMVVPLFDIQGIPFTLLLDQEGKIAGKNLRGPALEEKLAELLGPA